MDKINISISEIDIHTTKDGEIAGKYFKLK